MHSSSLFSPAARSGLAVLLISAAAATHAAAADSTRAGPDSAGESKTHAQQSASKLIGLPVRDAQNEKVGTVEDLTIDLSSGRVLGVVLSGGAGDKRQVVSPESLSRGASGKELRLDSTHGALSGLRQPTSREPDEGRREADNTARNRRDRDEHSRVDPLDQGNTRSDIETTARIRSAIVAREGLSTTAKNVKIVTREGQVTVRGPVATEQEKRTIAEIVAQSAPGARVDNQIEVSGR